MMNEPERRADSQEPDPWSNRIPATDLGGPEYGSFLEAFWNLQDSVVAANPPASVWADETARISEMAGRLHSWGVGEKEQPAGTRLDLPGRGHPFLLPFLPTDESDTVVRGKVTFRRFHLGGHGAAHGGALPLLFDEILGRLSNGGGRSTARTAYIKVNYRHITPLDIELDLEATYDREEGRKRWVSGRLSRAGTVLADAEGLFVELKPGQP